MFINDLVIYTIFHFPSSNYTCEQESHACYLIRSDPFVLYVYVSFHYLENAKAKMQMHTTHMRKCWKDGDICWRLLLNLSRALIKHHRIVSASSKGYILLFTRFPQNAYKGNEWLFTWHFTNKITSTSRNVRDRQVWKCMTWASNITLLRLCLT